MFVWCYHRNNKMLSCKLHVALVNKFIFKKKHVWHILFSTWLSVQLYVLELKEQQRVLLLQNCPSTHSKIVAPVGKQIL